MLVCFFVVIRCFAEFKYYPPGLLPTQQKFSRKETKKREIISTKRGEGDASTLYGRKTCWGPLVVSFVPAYSHLPRGFLWENKKKGVVFFVWNYNRRVFWLYHHRLTVILDFILFVGLNVISVLADNLETKQKKWKWSIWCETISWPWTAIIICGGYRPFLL